MNLTVIYIDDVRLQVLLENINSHFFESGTMPTPTKSQNSTGLVQEGPTSTQKMNEIFDKILL